MIDIKQKRAPRNRRKRSLKPDVARLEAAGEPPMKGNILAALRRSPLVGVDLNLVRSRGLGRKVDL
jgi:hypothetical protein